MALEIGPGDAVITTPYSFFATAACIARVGATPLFVDIEPETFNISSEAIRSFIKKNCHHANGVLMARDRQAIRLIIPVHLFGLCCEMDTIMEIAREHELLAAMLQAKLPHLAGWSAARRADADFYREEFSRRNLGDSIILPAEPYRERAGNHHIYHQFVIRAVARDELKAHLSSNEIESEIYYPVPLHLQECFFYLEHKEGDFPEAERAAAETLALPIYPELSREAQRFVVGKIAEFYS